MSSCGRSVSLTNYVIVSFIWIIGFRHVSAQYKDMTRLLDNLQKGYRKEVLPKRTPDSYVAVKVHPNIIRIEDLDAENEELLLTLSLTMSWIDERLSWDPGLYGELAKVYVQASQIWLPDIAVRNTIYPASNDVNSDQLVEVTNLGAVLYVKRVQVRSYCQVDLTWFPRDQHTCRIIFSSWVYSVDQILIQFWQESKDGMVDVPILADSDSNIPNVDGHYWLLQDRRGRAKISLVTYSCCPYEAYAQLNITVTIKRSADVLTYMYTIPMLVLSVLVPFQFMFSYTTSQRHIYGLLLVLGEILSLLLLLLKHIPEHANIPFIGIVHLVCLLSATCAPVLSHISSKLCQRNSNFEFCFKNPRKHYISSERRETKNEERYSKRNNFRQQNELLQINHTSENEQNGTIETENIPLVNIQNNEIGREAESATARPNNGRDKSTLIEILQEFKSLNNLVREKIKRTQTHDCTPSVFVQDKVLFAVFMVLFLIETLVLFCGLYSAY